jgi:DNA-binding transcriptional ArsR family regulator
MSAPRLGRRDGDGECDDRIGPPVVEDCVGGEADEDGDREVGAEDVLGPLAAGGFGVEFAADALHLRELRKAALVESTAAGRSNRYRLASVDLDELANLIGRLHADAPAAR